MNTTHNTQNQKIFIVGVGRSGTSLLQAILDSHSQISFLPETGYVRKYLLPRTIETEYSTNGKDGVRTLLEADSRLSRLPINIVDEFESIRSHANNTSTTSLDLAIYNQFHALGPSQYSGDKDPRLIEHVELLLNIWPDAKIIHIYRDPRDVIASKKKAGWSKGKSLFTQVLSTCAQFKLGIAHSKTSSDKNVFLIRYESLLAAPEQELSQLCTWLALDFEKQILDFTSSAAKLVFDDERQWKSEVLGPLLANNFNKWKNELTEFEIKLTEFSCSETMQLGDYQKNTPTSNLQTISAYLCSLVVKFGMNLYCWYRNFQNSAVMRKHFGK